MFFITQGNQSKQSPCNLSQVYLSMYIYRYIIYIRKFKAIAISKNASNSDCNCTYFGSLGTMTIGRNNPNVELSRYIHIGKFKGIAVNKNASNSDCNFTYFGSLGIMPKVIGFSSPKVTKASEATVTCHKFTCQCTFTGIYLHWKI